MAPKKIANCRALPSVQSGANAGCFENKGI
jgi:hypothetical protein